MPKPIQVLLYTSITKLKLSASTSKKEPSMFLWKKTLYCMAMVAILLVPWNMPSIHAGQGDTQTHSTGQRVYVPVYSSIRYLNEARYDLAVTISIRNTDPNHGLKVTSAFYYDNNGKPLRDFLEEPRTIPPFGSTELFIQQADLRSDTGANFVIEWKADVPISSPLIEAIMIGSRGTQGIAFTSRGVVFE